VQITTDEIIERGLAASSLLENPTFQSVVQSLMFECFAQFTETKPEDKRAREDTYNLYQGLKAIESELRSRVHLKDQTAERLDAEYAEDHEDLLDGPIHIQGNNDQ
jgi:hypothetical protein